MADNVQTVTGNVAAIIAAILPVVDIANPAIGAAMGVAAKILAGVSEAEPVAVALVDQIKSGAVPTDAQMAQYAADYEADYQALDADITAKLAALPATPTA